MKVIKLFVIYLLLLFLSLITIRKGLFLLHLVGKLCKKTIMFYKVTNKNKCFHLLKVRTVYMRTFSRYVSFINVFVKILFIL